MADKLITDAVSTPQDEGIGSALVDGEDETFRSAGAVAATGQAIRSSSYVASGSELVFSGHDGTNDTVDVTAGIAYLDLSSVVVDIQSGTGSDNLPPDYDTTLPSGGMLMIVVPSTVAGVALQDSTLSDVWLAYDIDGTGPGAAGSVYLRSDDTGSVSAPTHPSVKLGEANPDDATADVLSNRGPSPSINELTDGAGVTHSGELADLADIAVDSVFGRVGSVTAQAGDYAASQISNFASAVLDAVNGSAISPSSVDTDDETINNSVTWPDGSTTTTSPSTGGGDGYFLIDGFSGPRAHLTTAESIGDFLYVVGGWDGSSTLDTTSIYDAKTGSWTTGTVCPTTVREGFAGTDGTDFYFAGGFDNGNNTLAVTYQYDVSADSWTSLTNMPAAKRDGFSGVINGNLYAAGGRDSSASRVTSVYEYDISADSWSTVSSMPTALTGGASNPTVVHNGNLYCIGGVDSSGNRVNTVHKYDQSADSWSTVASYPTEISSSYVGVIDGKIYSVGGNGGSSPIDDVYVYDTSADNWTHTSTAPFVRRTGGGAVIDNRLYCLGGRNAASQVSNSFVYFPGT